MHQITTGEAIPFKAIDVAGSPGTFYDQTDRTRNRTLRRVAKMRRSKKYISFINRNIYDPMLLDDLKDHVAT
jgi:hypothetical protein